MKELFTLGELYPSDFLKLDEQPRSEKVEMKAIMTEEGSVRLEKTAELSVMYGERYWYRSGTNATMRRELQSIVESITRVKKLNENSLWIDIASNDGTLLSFVPKMFKVGIDPANDTYKQEAEKHCDYVIQDFFSAKTFKESKFKDKKADVITSIAMFYDLEHPEKFIQDIDAVLDDNGLWVLQLSYTPLMLDQKCFDNFCMEHVFYYSLFNLKNLFEKHNFQIVDCQLNDTNGGSFRVYAMKKSADIKTFASQQYRDVCNIRVNSLLEYEKHLELDKEETWHKFYKDINELKTQTLDFIKAAKAQGKTIWALGASTKGNTVLQYFNLDNSLIDGIAERTPYKFGLKTVGTNIPIYSEEEFRKAKPDITIVLIWMFIEEIKTREAEYLENGGTFVVLNPKFEIITK